MNKFRDLDKYKVDIVNKASNLDKDEFISCIIISETGKPLRLLRRNDIKLDAGRYDFCSGHMKRNGETPLLALIRELTEEIKFEAKNIKEIYTLGTIETPHEKLKGTLTHFYCLVTSLTEEEINEKISKEEEPELQNGTFLDSMEIIESEICNPSGNWRFTMSNELKEQFTMIKNIINDRIAQNNLMER